MQKSEAKGRPVRVGLAGRRGHAHPLEIKKKKTLSRVANVEATTLGEKSKSLFG